VSQTTELVRVKARIRALAEKTVSNGCTEAEAMAAAEMVGRLLERYALSMQEIDVRQEVCVQVEVPVGGKQRRPIDGCVTAIARFCDCKVWISRDTGQPNYVFFGFEADRLDVMHRARDASVAAQRSTGTALILVKHRVVDDAFRETAIRLVSAGRLSRVRMNGAFRHGLAAGDRVNLNRPVGDTGRALLP
jgi:hypothetical protein